MKRTLLSALTLLLLGTTVASAAGPVAIPMNRKVISVGQQKSAITKYLNRMEGRKLSFDQRRGSLGGFKTVGGDVRTWSVTGPRIVLPPPGGPIHIFPIPSSHAGEINVNADHSGPRVTIYPSATAAP